MDRGLQKIAMADDLDVDALLEAPYTKYEVGTTTNHSVSWLLWSCQLFGIQVFSLGLPSWKIFFFLSWFLYDFGSLITVPVRYLFFLHILLCAKFTKTLIRSRTSTGSFLKCFFVIWLSFDRYLTGSEKLQSGELLSIEDTYSKILHFKVWIIEF